MMSVGQCCCAHSWWAIVVFVGLVLQQATSQTLFECPDDWVTFKDHCYRFEASKPESYDEAWSKCSIFGAGLLNVDDLVENSFVQKWLTTSDPYHREWYTSGVVYPDMGSGPPKFAWQSTGFLLDPSLYDVWLQPPRRGQEGVIIYKMGDTSYGWTLGNPQDSRLYVCKIHRSEAYRIYYRLRGDDYGLPSNQLDAREHGPVFVLKPKSIVVVIEKGRQTEPAVLECIVQSNPDSTYQWYKGEFMETLLTSDIDNRYSLTNGKLEIVNPTERQDSDFYTCTAENKIGKILSETVEISFGSLGEFNSVADAGTSVRAFNGAQLQCSQISYKPAVSYQWVKGDYQQFVRPQYQNYIFISNNGKLYFSEVTTVDEAEYSCMVALRGMNQYQISTSQPPMRTSLPIPLDVIDQPPKASWGPVIQDEFIAVFPSPPLVGYDVRMECLAYGSMSQPFYYQWSREGGKKMPDNAKMYDHNRVLLIRNARLEDGGMYRCSVSRGGASDSKTIDLVLSAKPYFVSPLRNQMVDVGTQFTWICGARGNPNPTYTWYMNGKRLVTDRNKRVMVQSNVLTISDLDKDLHDGMYQCAVKNAIGSSMSTAQLKVLSFPPNFDKHPTADELISTESGDVSLPCQPEGSPHPQITWDKDGRELQTDNTKYKILGNGNLRIYGLGAGDEGTYTCTATNIFGVAGVSTKLRITGGAAITIPLRSVDVIVNQTQLLRCEASFPAGLDMIYEWLFNGYRLDMRDQHYRKVDESSGGTVGLYVVSAQRKHEGEYTCTARTPFNSASSTGYLQVIGPPRQPAGLNIPPNSITNHSAEIKWSEVVTSGNPLSHHVIQMVNEFEPDDWKDILVLSVEESKDESVRKLTGRHAVNVVSLNPGTGYAFRIIGLNSYGRGEPSLSSSYIRTISAPPAVAPVNLRGGGGSEGLLTIMWNPLHPSEYGGLPVKYRIFWKLTTPQFRNERAWGIRQVDDAQTGMLAILVGNDNYHLPYDTKIQAFNNLGYGPNSSVVTVYSAEGIPVKSPEGVSSSTFNSTALLVTWTPVPNNRLNIKGKIQGYQINYWNAEDDPQEYHQFIRYYGQRGEGMVIGLVENNDWFVDVQVFNTAGLSPRSNKFIMETSGYAPLTYPQEVRVSSAGMNKVHVWWRGITMTVDEEALSGFAIWVWVATEEFRTARLIDIEEIIFEYTIDDIEEGFVYALRLAAVGGGGYGVKTPTMYFTMEGQILIDSGFAQTIDIFLSTASLPQVSTIFTTFVTFIAFLLTSLNVKC